MRFVRTSILAAVVAVSFIPSSAHAQRRAPRSWEREPSRFSIVGDLLVAQPKGEFATQLDTEGFGINVGALFRIDREGLLSIRGDLGGMQYGSETLHAPYLPITGRVALDIETTNTAGLDTVQVTVTAVSPNNSNQAQVSGLVYTPDTSTTGATQ